MSNKKKFLSRRTFLRGTAAGLGVSLALPPLEAMLTNTGSWADGSGDEPFFALLFWANGLPWHAGHGAAQAGQADLWTPTATGPGYAPSPLLAPLMRHQVNVATGLTPTTGIPAMPGGQGDGHMRGFMVALTGDRPRSVGFDHPTHTLTALRPTLDQYVARHPEFYPVLPRFRSVQVGVSPARFHNYGHWNGISYNGPESINPPIMQPTQLFDLLFDAPINTGESGAHSKALDAVLADATSLENRLGMRDRARLEEHLEHVFEIQRRLGGSGVCEEPQMPSNNGSLKDRTTAYSDLLATAVNCGVTRSVSFMLTSPATTHVFSNLGVPDGMHKGCHDGDWDDVRKITLHHMEAFALFLDAFTRIEKPAGGTLLDDGVVFGTSEYGEGFQHSVAEFPVVIAGGGCGRLNAGVHVRDVGGSISRAHLTALRALGLSDASFGWNGGETSNVLGDLLA